MARGLKRMPDHTQKGRKGVAQIEGKGQLSFSRGCGNLWEEARVSRVSEKRLVNERRGQFKKTVAERTSSLQVLTRRARNGNRERALQGGRISYRESRRV